MPLLATLAELAREPAERVRLLRRLAVAAKDLASDLEMAAHALSEVLRLEPEDFLAWGELCALQRRRADMPGLAAALAQRARVAETQATTDWPRPASASWPRWRRPGWAASERRWWPSRRRPGSTPARTCCSELADLSLRCERPEHARRALEDVLVTLPRTGSPEKLAEVRAKLGQACEMTWGISAAAAAHYAEALPYRRGDDALAARLEGLYEKLGRSKELAEVWALRARQLLAEGRTEAAAPLLFKGARALLAPDSATPRTGSFTRRWRSRPAGSSRDRSSRRWPSSSSPPATAPRPRSCSRGRRRWSATRLRGAPLPPGGGGDAGRKPRPGLSRRGAQTGRLASRGPGAARHRPRLPSDARGALDDFEAALQLLRTDSVGLRPEERARLLRSAAAAARGAQEPELARRYLAGYTDVQPEDVEAQLELATLYREAGALEALQSLLGTLWPRLSGAQARDAARELVALSVEMQRPAEAVPALRELLRKDPQDSWAAEALLGLLAGEGPAREEALALRSLLAASTVGSVHAAHLVERARLLRALGRPAEARSDLCAPPRTRASPGPYGRKWRSSPAPKRTWRRS